MAMESLRWACVLLFAVMLGLGTVILTTSWQTLRQVPGPHLMWWHVAAINIATWGWAAYALIPIFNDIGSSGAGFTPLSVVYIVLAGLTNWALVLILKVQRGRRGLSR